MSHGLLPVLGLSPTHSIHGALPVQSKATGTKSLLGIFRHVYSCVFFLTMEESEGL